MSKRTKGTLVLNTEIDADIRRYVKYHAQSRGETLRAVVERALLAEFKSAPPIPVPPPIPEDEPKQRRRGVYSVSKRCLIGV